MNNIIAPLGGIFEYIIAMACEGVGDQLFGLVEVMVYPINL